jgi:predicted RNA-binding protein Jag
MAREMAEQAISTNAEVVTDYLNSQERRIIHVTLKEDSRVKTYSLGMDRSKRVAIAPADFPERTGEEHAG